MIAEVGLAAAPLLLAAWLLVGRRTPGWRAGGAAWVLAIGLAAVGPFATAPSALLAANVRGLLLSCVVVYVLAGGLLLHNVLERAGAMRVLAGALATTTRDPARRALLVAGALSPFFESVSGFGLAVVVVGPLLVQLGFDPRRATVLALLGQNAVPWGAMAIGTLLGAELAGLSARQMGVGSAWLNAPLAVLYNAVTVAVAAGAPMVVRRLPDILAGAAALAGGVLVGSTVVSVELAGVLGGLLAAATQVLIARLVEGRGAAARRPEGLSPLRAAAPYAVLLAGLLASRLVPPLRGALEDALVLDAVAYGVRLPLLVSPGFFLFLAAVAAVPLLGLSPRRAAGALPATVRQGWPAAAATAAFVTLSTVMVAAGMTSRLAAAAAAAAGPAFVLLSPFVGGLAGFMTGSNTAGNAMFARFQVETAGRAGLRPDVLAYVNNVAAANATMASPSRVVLATTVTGRAGAEGEAARAILPVVAAALALIAAHAAAWVVWG